MPVGAPLATEHFRSLQGTRFVLDQTGQQNGPAAIKGAALGLMDRIRAVRDGGSFAHGTMEHVRANQTFKLEFYDALIKAEGLTVARAAAKAAGLPDDWATRANSMSGARCRRVLDAAQHIRMDLVKDGNRAARAFVAGQPAGATNLAGALARGLRPAADAANRDLQATFLREVRADAGFGHRRLDAAALATIADRAVGKFYARKEAQFAEAHPGLRAYQTAHPGDFRPVVEKGAVLTALRAQLTTGSGHALAGETAGLRDLLRDALTEVETNGALLGTMTYTPEGWDSQTAGLLDKLVTLGRLEQTLGTLAGTPDAPGTAPGQALVGNLMTELHHQQDLVLSKLAFVDDVRNADPLSDKSVAYSDMLWAQAVDHIVAGVLADPSITLAPGGHGALSDFAATLVTGKCTAYMNARPDMRSNGDTVDKKTHPAAQTKADLQAQLTAALKAAGVPDKDVKELAGGKSFAAARTHALNTCQEWAPVQNRMVVTKDGVTREYLSVITPAAGISPRFAGAAGNQKTAGLGVSSAVKDSPDHARNLKLSELKRAVPGGAPVTVARVIGHGVLDMWKIADPAARRAANENGAREVLEAALVTNPRLAAEAAARHAAGNTAPLALTHVSVNLITPTATRELPGVRRLLPDHQELTYTRAQFAAFEAVSSPPNGAPVTLAMDDPAAPGQTLAVPVRVDTIAFSFGINPMATGKASGLLGGWDNVFHENRDAMIRFVGDLGKEIYTESGEFDRFAEFGSQGTPPGGFVGSVYDRLDPAVPAQADLKARMRVQTNTVRELFVSGAYRSEDGDPAKMGREILALQALAEEALGLVGGPGEAATMSKGCKSDKDRGGVTDVELKHKLITDEMGGPVTSDAELGRRSRLARVGDFLFGRDRDLLAGAVPNARLRDDDLTNYGIVSARSGQFENQTNNTGLPGSKEAAKVSHRNVGTELRQFLAGLGKLASE
ncbi:inositol phosphate phosphatase SopB [Methylobacterium oryzihabitans]|uniref:Uncharacterized protein n=1 Tax=Methylobacterium oryzihabitans TaxID=2499852 RepID=A0A3S2W7T3_9HYPH|nr:inositol phosphate phosphatase SopB [Methylobacterium oryzihabitans]RVU15822.1 hypothetical protein EOE48_18680 [Methylobacterium oryzihabitans]